MFPLSVILLLAWGALAFGADYAWAYTPLLVFSLVPAILGLRASRGAHMPRALLLALGAIFVAGVLQVVVPVEQRAVDFHRIYSDLLIQPRTDTPPRTVISIAPQRTMLGLAFLAAFTLLLAGCTRGISALGPRRIMGGIVILGVVVAMIGIVQSAVQSPTIYGFWRHSSPWPPFAPFMNQNHFAGWTAMVMSLAMGAFAGGMARADVRPGLRNRILWFSSPRAGKMMLTLMAVLLMALSIVLTRSRGGLLALMATGLISALWMLRRQSGFRRALGGVSVAAIVVLVMYTGGAGTTIERFGNTSRVSRTQIWKDTWRVIKDNPFAGTGLNTFGIAMLHYQDPSQRPASAAVEAHNDYLQLISEGGVLLGIPILAAIFIAAREVLRRFREGADDVETYWLRAGAVIGLCAIGLMESYDFTLQTPGAAVMFVVLVAIAIHRPARAESRHR